MTEKPTIHIKFDLAKSPSFEASHVRPVKAVPMTYRKPSEIPASSKGFYEDQGAYQQPVARQKPY